MLLALFSLLAEVGIASGPRSFERVTRHVVPPTLRSSPRARSGVQCHNHHVGVSTVLESAGEGCGKVFRTDDHAIADLFLRDRRGDIQQASEKLREAVEWRKTFGDIPIPEHLYREEESETGKCALHHKLDRDGRAVIIVRVDRHVINDFPLESSKALCVATIEKALEQLDQRGEISVIFNLNGFGLRNADFAFAKFLVKTLYKYYPQRLGAAYMVDAPLLFQGPWKIVKPWLRRYASLVTFLPSNKVSGLFDDPVDAPTL